jgi:hypothetical protein
MFLRISAPLCPSDAQSPHGLKRSDGKLHWHGPEWWRSSLLLMPSAINGLSSSVREKPGRRFGSNPSPAWQTDSRKKSKARLLVLSEKLQFPCIGHTRSTTMLEKQIDEIR